MEIAVYNHQGKTVGNMELPAAFALPWNADLVHQVVTSQASNRRPVVAHAKGRSEVRGGGPTVALRATSGVIEVRAAPAGS